MNTTESLRPSDLALATYGSPLRKPVIGWALAAALLALITFSLTQLVPFLDHSSRSTWLPWRPPMAHPAKRGLAALSSTSR